MYWHFSVINDWKGLKKYCIGAYIVLCICILVWKIYLCEKSLLFPSQPPVVFTRAPGFLAKKTVDKDIAYLKRHQRRSYRSNYHRNHNFKVTTTNTRIIKIAASSQDSNSSELLCAHFLIFDKTYHFMKSAYISCMVLTMALCSPPFPWFIHRKWKWRCANSGIFRIHPSAPPPAGGFSIYISVAEKSFFK